MGRRTRAVVAAALLLLTLEGCAIYWGRSPTSYFRGGRYRACARDAVRVTLEEMKRNPDPLYLATYGKVVDIELGRDVSHPFYNIQGYYYVGFAGEVIFESGRESIGITITEGRSTAKGHEGVGVPNIQWERTRRGDGFVPTHVRVKVSHSRVIP